MNSIGAKVCTSRGSWFPWIDYASNGHARHLDVFIPLPFDRDLWIYYSRGIR